MNQTIRLSLQDLDISLEDFNLHDINLDIYQGEYFVLLGPTGAGKTVLLEAIAGLKQPRRGGILLDGVEISGWPPEDRQIGFVYQEYALFPHLKVADNIAFGLRLMEGEKLRRMGREDPLAGGVGGNKFHGKGRPTKQQIVEKEVKRISRLLKIDHLLARDPTTLSGGEKQRVALARALIIEPRVLLLDEPLSALDPETSERLQRELNRIHHELGTTTLHITHHFEEAMALGDRIGIMMGGKIVQVGKPQDVFRRPKNEQVARFVGVRNLFQGRITSSDESDIKGFSTHGFEFAVLTDHEGGARLSIRPEDILLSNQPVLSSARNNYQGRVIEISDRGSYVYVTVRLSPGGDHEAGLLMTCMITHRSMEEMNLVPGSHIHLAFKASAFHVF